MCAGGCSSCNNIYLGYHIPVTSTSDSDLYGHGLFEGQAVIYQVSDPAMAIVGLTPNTVYYVHLDDQFLLSYLMSVQLSTTADLSHACRGRSRRWLELDPALR